MKDCLKCFPESKGLHAVRVHESSLPTVQSSSWVGEVCGVGEIHYNCTVPRSSHAVENQIMLHVKLRKAL